MFTRLTAAALAALVLSPAGAEVRDWISDTIDPGVRNAEPALTSLPSTHTAFSVAEL